MEKLTTEQSALVENNVKLARRLAMIVWNRNKEELEGGEVVAVAFQGLIGAAVRYKPESGVPFGSYAQHRIMGSILDWQRSRDHVPRQQRKEYRTLQQHGHGSGTPLQDLAEATGFDVDKIVRITNSVEGTDLSLDYSFGNEDDEGHSELAVGKHSVETSLVLTSVMLAIGNVWDSLPVLERRVLVGKYYLDQDLREIAENTGERLSKVREAHSQMVMKFYTSMLDEAS